MIDPVSSQAVVNGLQRLTPGLEAPPLGNIRGAPSLGGLEGPSDAGKPTSFVDMIGDLVTAYLACRAGTVTHWPPLPISYIDYTLWKHEQLGEFRQAVASDASWRRARAVARSSSCAPS